MDPLTVNPRLEIRTNYKVRLKVTYMNGIYKVNEFHEEHNLLFYLLETICTYLLSVGL